PLTRNTNPKVLPIKQWKPTGRLIPLEEQCPLARLTALNRGTMLADPQENNTPVAYNLVVQIVLWYLDLGCSKHMIGDRSRLRNFLKKFIGTVRFGNDHFGAIMGYGDYVIGDSVIFRVYYVEGLGHNLFSVGQFYDSDLEVAFRKHTFDDYSRFTWVKFLRSKDETLEFAVKLLKQLQVGLNKTVKNAPLFLWAEAIATACYTQNWSLIHTRHNKTPYELVHDKKLDLSFLRVFEAFCYPTNDSKDLGKLKAKADIGFFSMFGDYFEPYTVDWPVPHATQVSVNPIDPSVSISVDQDAPTSLDHQSFSVHHGVAAEHSFEVNPFALAVNEPFVNIFALDPSSEASSSGEITIAESNQST
ncbi:integrase, catalytic region, zinc finger, CCHC-type containing protein, partial [Tanacetum coccineum]